MTQEVGERETETPGLSRRSGIGPSRLRDHNERVVLATVRDHGPIASAEIARNTRLSAQTASVITRSLEADGLLLRGTPQRGRVGKPSVPVMLNPDGALSFGLNLGRRGAALVLIDLVGKIRAEERLAYPYPTPPQIRDFTRRSMETITASLPVPLRDAIVGFGIGAPFEPWKWLDAVKAPKEEMQQWQDFDFARDFSDFTDLPITVANDATMACSGERAFGAGRALNDFLYFHIGSFIGGGLVLDGHVMFGRNGNAGAFGSIPVGDTSRPRHQLIHNASIYALEEAIRQATGESVSLWGRSREWTTHADLVEAWIDHAAASIAQAIVAATAVVDIPTTVIDGEMPGDIKDTLIESIAAHLDRLETEGLGALRLVPGRLGPDAGAVGAAYQPIRAAQFPMASSATFG